MRGHTPASPAPKFLPTCGQETPLAKIWKQGWLAELLQGGEPEEALPSGTDSVEQLGFWLDEP